jgi:hypothetical protein
MVHISGYIVAGRGAYQLSYLVSNGLSVVISSQQWFSSGYLLEVGLFSGHTFAGMVHEWLHRSRKGGLSVVVSSQQWFISGHI